MDDSAQQRLFAETPGSIEPPEERLYLGTSGWSYADWEGTLYPEGLPAASRLAEYVKSYATVEIDSSFYGTPRRSTVQNWREIAPDGFLFAAKFPQEVTHERNLISSEAETESFISTMDELGDRLGPLLLQLPPSFTVEGMGVLEDFLKGLPEGFRYAVEVRHRSWLGSDLPEMLRERGVALTLIDYPRRSEEHTSELQSRQYLVCRLLLEKKTIKDISSSSLLLFILLLINLTWIDQAQQPILNFDSFSSLYCCSTLFSFILLSPLSATWFL